MLKSLVNSVSVSNNRQKNNNNKKLFRSTMLWLPHQTHSVYLPDYYWLTQAQTPTLSINVFTISSCLHLSYNNMHKQIQSELKSLPEHCPPYGPRNKVLTFNFHLCTFISIHEYANPTVPLAIMMQSPSGRCQHCQGRKKPTPFRLLGTVHMCVCECVRARACACVCVLTLNRCSCIFMTRLTAVSERWE